MASVAKYFTSLSVSSFSFSSTGFTCEEATLKCVNAHEIRIHNRLVNFVLLFLENVSNTLEGFRHVESDVGHVVGRHLGDGGQHLLHSDVRPTNLRQDLTTIKNKLTIIMKLPGYSWRYYVNAEEAGHSVEVVWIP